MPQKASKQQAPQQITMVLNGGLNYSQSSANIADNELKRAINFIYDPATDFLMTRPGTKCQTAAALPTSITKGFYYEVSASEAYHVVAAGTKLYYLSGASLDTWTEIGTNLLTGTHPPSFLVFNNLLHIADGDANGIKTWAGAIIGTVSTGVTNSPDATALSMIKNRMVANHVTELDSVYLSAPNDASATGWNTATTAVGLKAGFGDLLTVNAFAVLGDDLIISKVGDREKRIYRVNVSDAATTAWYVADLSQNNAAQNAHTMIGAWNNVFFVDTNGFKSIKGTDSYGDLEVDPVGRKLNTIFQQTYTSNFLTYVPSYNSVFFNVGDRVFAYTERIDQQADKKISAFTDMYFAWGKCNSMYEAGDTVYLCGNNGYLYKFDTSVATDETVIGTTVGYTAAVRGKTLTFFVDGILRKLQWYLNPKTSGSGKMYVCSEDETKVLVNTFTIPSEGEYVFDSTGKLNVAVDELYDSGNSAWIESSRNRFRNEKMAFELELTSGRCGIQWCKAEIALLEGGE